RTIVLASLVGVACAAAPEEARVRERVEKIRASDTEDWRRIPWTRSLLDAAAAARKEGRPMFVFSHEGNIDTGRCCNGARDMRVSSPSDARIIRLVSRNFVPAWLSRDRYQLEAVPREEQALVARIDADRKKKALEGGAVCVYLV